MVKAHSTHAREKSSRRKGFTLVELLVVIAVMAVLAAMLLPVMGRAREQFKMTVCQNGMRQMMVATLRYTQDNNDHYPFAAVNALPEDWVYWQPGRAGLTTGGIMKYIGMKNPAQLLLCQDDNVSVHSAGFPFSYSMNWNIGGYYPWGDNAACYSYYSADGIKRIISNKGVGQVKHASNCICFIEESELTIDDGCWAWQADGEYGESVNELTARHDQYNRELIADPTNPSVGRGNVAFCDGHVAFTLRADIWNPVYWDPTQ